MCNDAAGVDGYADDQEARSGGNGLNLGAFPHIEMAAIESIDDLARRSEDGFGLGYRFAVQAADNAPHVAGTNNTAPIGNCIASDQPEAERCNREEEKGDFKYHGRTLLYRCRPRRVRLRQVCYFAIRIP